MQARSRAAREALDMVPELLEQLRQSVLAAAFRGDLTADWREQHPDAEPAEVLLGRIRLERRRQWEARNPRKKYVEPERADDADLPELPEGWCWTSIEEVSEWVKDGTHWPPPTTTSGVPFIGIRNVIDGRIDWGTVDRWVSDETHAGLTERFPPRPGDVLYTAVGATFGRAFPIPDNRKFIFQRHIAHLRPLPILDAAYMVAAINSPFGFEQSKSFARGAAQPTVTLTDLKRMLIPICTVTEQSAIHTRVGRAMTLLASVGTQLVEARAALNAVDQSILAKAFRGELVEQDPADEPAAQLLARIRDGGGVVPTAPTRLRIGDVVHDLVLLLRSAGGSLDRASLELGLVLVLDDAARTAILDKTVRVPRGPATGRPLLRGLEHLLGDLRASRFITASDTIPQIIALTPDAPPTDGATTDDRRRVQETLKVMATVKKDRLAATVEQVCRVAYELVR